MKNYYKELPENFKEDFVIDAKSKKTSIILTLISMGLLAAVFALIFFTKFYGTGINYNEDNFSVFWLGAFVGIFAYVILHELTHGLFYYLFTKQKLTFGLTLFVAYCGLKEGYVNKTVSLVSSLAPFVIHSIWMLLLIILLPASPWLLVLSFIFALHFGGCCGDIYVTGILLFRYNKKQVLVRDNGYKQSFYIEQK